MLTTLTALAVITVGYILTCLVFDRLRDRSAMWAGPSPVLFRRGLGRAGRWPFLDLASHREGG